MLNWRLLQPLRLRNFRVYWIGQSLTVIGAQFYFIALPWLVLTLTGDPVAMGTVLAVSAIPRAAVMLLSGSLIDWLSPRRILLVANTSRVAMLVLFSWIILEGGLDLTLLYVFVIVYGLAEGASWPCYSAIIPYLLRSDEFQTGNAVVQGTGRLSSLVGPALAGGMIAWFAAGPDSGPLADGAAEASAGDLAGIAYALLITAATFAAGAFYIWRVDLTRPRATPTNGPGLRALWQSTKEGIHYVWTDPPILALLVIIAAIDFLFIGVVRVGIPSMAAIRFEGAESFGIMMSALGAGALVGTVLVGSLKMPRPHLYGPILGFSILAVGLGFVGIGMANDLPAALLMMAVIGFADGYFSILLMTLLQRRTPEDRLGRVMSLLMLVSTGIDPFSTAAAGFLMGLGSRLLFVGSGTLSSLIGIATALNRTLRTMGDGLPADRAAEAAPVAGAS